MTYLVKKVRKYPIFYLKSSDNQKKGHHACRCPICTQIQVKSKKKGLHIRKCPILLAKTGKIAKTGHHARKKMKTDETNEKNDEARKNEKNGRGQPALAASRTGLVGSVTCAR